MFNPVINPLITFSLLVLADQPLKLAEKIKFSGIASLFASGLVILCLFIFMRLGLINSPDIPDRKQRSFPLIVAAIVLFAGFLTLSFAHAPNLIQGLMWCYATETLIVAIISYWWKTSIHTGSMACSLVALTLSIWRDFSSLLSITAASGPSANYFEAIHNYAGGCWCLIRRYPDRDSTAVLQTCLSYILTD
ncbi:hypothetical protein [Leptolyngbya sp. FACHB-261]|uniref:hypothetical protein n=1 Tax=Leptolyngbya sp. FACHB-261 TaxID=2692806 RepID=UPI0016862E72|nr:hypothetical protein [Leptolyngbya sp. FACHB-261]